MKAKFKFSEYFVFPLSFTLFLQVLHLLKPTNKNYTMSYTLSSLTSSGKKASFFLDRVMCCSSQYLHAFKILRHRWQQIIVRFGTRITVCWMVVWMRMAPVGHYLWILPSPIGGCLRRIWRCGLARGSISFAPASESRCELLAIPAVRKF